MRFDGAELDCPVYQRERLDVGSKLAGPAILEQLDCTTFICPEQVARVDEWKNLLVMPRRVEARASIASEPRRMTVRRTRCDE